MKHRPRSPELLRDIETDVRAGWSLSYAAAKNGTYLIAVMKWAKVYPEWAAIKRLGNRGKGRKHDQT